MVPGLDISEGPAETTETPFLNGHTKEYPNVVNGLNYRTNATFLPREDYEIGPEPIHTRRHVRVVCLGAGYSGLMWAILHSQKLRNKNVDLVIYERNEDLGGTWLENKYPGCQCDIPAHNYAFSFEPNPSWPNYYARSGHIHDYMKNTAEKYDVQQYIKYKHSIKHAQWDDQAGKWRLKVERGNDRHSSSGDDSRNGDSNGQGHGTSNGTSSTMFEDECDIFINAGGVLNAWKWPDIDGLHDFKGKLVHSASWDTTLDMTGKKVGVIGIGSSAIQIIPNVARDAAKVTSFIRSKAWISPAPGINEPTDDDPEMDEAYNYAPEVLEKFKSDPVACQKHRQNLIDRRLANFKRSMKDSDTQKKAQELFRENMRQRLGDSEKGRKLAEMLIPDFPVGCRRQTPGMNYLEALLKDNVHTRWDDVGRITEKGILCKSGEELEFDVIVCATGFDTTFQPRFPVIGRNKVDLAERWAEELPLAYFGMTVPDFPNYFSFIGPGSPISNGSLVVGIQMMAIYIYKCITKLQTESIRSLTVSHAACQDYNEHIQKFLQRTVWTGGCRSWYKRGTIDGPVVAIYGGTSFHYVEALRNPRWEDYEIELVPMKAKNRFEYLGNGFTNREVSGGSVAATQTLNFDEYWDLLVLPELYD